jgi:hypothetical protein
MVQGTNLGIAYKVICIEFDNGSCITFDKKNLMWFVPRDDDNSVCDLDGFGVHKLENDIEVTALVYDIVVYGYDGRADYSRQARFRHDFDTYPRINTDIPMTLRRDGGLFEWYNAETVMPEGDDLDGDVIQFFD